MKWFGERPFSTLCVHADQVATPVGTPCLWCEEPIALGDAGYLIPTISEAGACAPSPWHADCHLRSIVGSVAHLEGRCSCKGGSDDLPEGVTRREEAKRAAAIARWRYGRVPPERPS